MAENIVRAFEETVRRSPDRSAARFRAEAEAGWTTKTWSEMDKDRRILSSGLLGLGLEPGERAAILANSSYGWMVADLAIQSAGAETVPIYHSLLPHDCVYILKDSGASFVFADNEVQLEKLLSEREHLGHVKKVILMNGVAAAGDGWVISWKDVVEEGKAKLEARSPEIELRVSKLTPSSVLTLIYTSGTTGPPKGVVLSHSCMLYEMEAVRQIELIGPEDLQLFYLPMAHSFAKVLQCVWFGTGHEMAIDSELTRITQNLGEVRPTVMASVPRIFEKVFAAVVGAGVATPGLKGKLFKWAVDLADRYATLMLDGQPVPFGLHVSLAVAKKLVFSKVHVKLGERFGGRLRYFISGGAPLPAKMAYFFALADVVILEGYGLTETSAATCVNRPSLNKIGTVGPVIPGSELRIAADGEILVKGPGVMRGYYNLPDATREVLSPEGWFSTGDIGRIDADGYLRITDRKKDIIVTAGGKNVAPQNIENLLKTTNPLIAQVLVHGDRRKFLSALITLDPERSKAFAEKHGLSTDYKEIARSEPAKQEIQGAINTLNSGLAQYETIKKFAILEKDFEIGDELTPTLKVKRRVCEQKYRAILDGFYDEQVE